MNGELFDIPECPSPKLAWIREYEVRTHHKPSHDKEWLPWSSWLPEHDWSSEESGCYNPENESLVGFGETKDDAMIDMAVKNNLKLWNQQ